MIEVFKRPRDQIGVGRIIQAGYAVADRLGCHRFAAFEQGQGSLADQNERGFVPLAEISNHSCILLSKGTQPFRVPFRHRGFLFLGAVLMAAGRVMTPGST